MAEPQRLAGAGGPREGPCRIGELLRGGTPGAGSFFSKESSRGSRVPATSLRGTQRRKIRFRACVPMDAQWPLSPPRLLPEVTGIGQGCSQALGRHFLEPLPQRLETLQRTSPSSVPREARHRSFPRPLAPPARGKPASPARPSGAAFWDAMSWRTPTSPRSTPNAKDKKKPRVLSSP